MTIAVVLATAPGQEGGPAAALRWEDGTLIGRLLRQLESLDVRRVHVITRPGWDRLLETSLAASSVSLRVHVSAGVAEDLRVLADIAGATRLPIVVVPGEVLTHREALAGLLADPRVVTGILAGRPRRRWVFRVRASRGRIVSAGSPYHSVRRPNASFLGVLKIDPRDRQVLVQVAAELSELLAPGVPAEWAAELDRKTRAWRSRLAKTSARSADETTDVEPVRDAVDVGPDDRSDEFTDDTAEVPSEEVSLLSPEEEREIGRVLAMVREDLVPLLLVGLVRNGVHVTNSYLRKLFWARLLSQDAAGDAAERITRYDEDRVLLDSAVKANDGFFTTFFVSPYSKYLARWAARAGLTPNIVTTMSMGIGILAALAFAAGSRLGMVAGAVLLQLAFTADCVDGQLARYTRTFSKLGAWLDSVFDRAKEYVVFAGLALGSVRGFGTNVWGLAAVALTVQIVRHQIDFSYAATQHQAMSSGPRLPLLQPSDRAGAGRLNGSGPEPLPTSPPAGAQDASPDWAAPPAPVSGSLSPAPAPLLVAELPSEDPAPPPRPPLYRRVMKRLAARAIRLSRATERRTWARWIKKIVVFPIGERFAVISLAAALTTPRTTFLVVLAWGSLAAAYHLIGRVLRSFAR